MKNKTFINSLNKIKPDKAQQELMLNQIFEKTTNRKVNVMNRTIKRIIPIAASFILIFALGFFAFSNMNSIKKGTIGNETLSFYKSGALTSDSIIDENISSRQLTLKENQQLFAGFEIATANGLFKDFLIQAEVKTADNLKIILCQKGYNFKDTVIEGNEKVSDILGIKVSAGYFVTDKNSKGIKNIIYFASFEIDEVSYYVELGGEEAKSDALRGQVSSAIEKLIKNGAPKLTEIKA